MSDASTPTTTAPPDDGRPPRRPVQFALHLLLRTLLVVVLLVAAFLLAVQNPAVGTRIVLWTMGRIQLPRQTTMTVREVRGNWIQELEFDGFRLARGETLLVAIDTLHIHHRPDALLAGHVDIVRFDVRGVTVTGDVIDTTTRAPSASSLSIGDLLHGRFYKGMPVRLRAASIERARFVPGLTDTLPPLDDFSVLLREGRIGDGKLELRIDRLVARSGAATLTATGAVTDGRLDVGSFVVNGGATRLAGKGAITTGAERGAGIEQLAITADAAPLVLKDLRPWLPALDLGGELTAHVELGGARSDSLDGVVTASADSLRSGPWAAGVTRLEARFARGRADLELNTVHEQARIAVRGWVRPLDARPTYDLGATAAGLPRRVPGVAGWDAATVTILAGLARARAPPGAGAA